MVEDPNFFYLEELGKSGTGLKGRFPLRTYRWSCSFQQPDMSTYTFWELRTNVRISKFLDCKKLEHVLLGLPDFELQGLIDAPGVISDRLFLDSLRALLFLKLESDRSRPILLQRLQRLQPMLGRVLWSENLLYTYLGNLKYELVQCRVPIRKVRKFSGWVRNSSAVGSKRKSGQLDLDPEIVESYVEMEDLDFYQYLTSEDPDFDDLGIPAGTLLYPLMKSFYDSGKPLPNNFFKYIK